MFGLNALLVSIMLVAASVSFVISYYKVNDVRLRVSHLANIVVPLTQAAANVDAYSLEEEIYLERALRQWTASTTLESSYEREIEEFFQLEARVQEELQIARDNLTTALANPQWLSPEDGIAFGRVSLLLDNIEKEHREFFQHAQTTITSLDSTSAAIIEERITELESEADHLDSELFALLTILQELNITQASEIEAAESMIMGIYQQNFILTFIVFVTGIALSATITTRMVKPVKELKDHSEEIRRGNLDIEVIPRSKDEIGQLAYTFNHMTQELKANSQVKELFGKYVDPRIVDSLLVEENDVRPFEGNKQEKTIFFSDVKGFSGMSEVLTPAGLVKLINRYYSYMTEPILMEKGVIDKYVGDSIMAFWGPPFTGEENYAELACHAALAQFQQLDKLNASLPEILGFRKGIPEFEIRVGLATGNVVAGNIGSENAKSYTVMGDTVNIASRLESLNKQYNTRILIDERTRDRMGQGFVVRELDRVTVAGKDEATGIFELFAAKEMAEQALLDLFDRYEEGLEAYRKMDWESATRNFNACLEINPEDGPSKLLLGRAESFKLNPPESDWDGIWHYAIK